MWFLDRLEPGSAFYNISVTVHLHGETDSGSLREGLQRLQDRHEILRTVLIGGEQDESGVWQDVLARDAQPLPWTFEDWRSRGEAAAGQRWRELAGQESGRGFDLAKGPLWRTCVIQCDDAHAVLIMTLHHAIADGWSMSVLVDELAAHYEAARAGARQRAAGVAGAVRGLRAVAARVAQRRAAGTAAVVLARAAAGQQRGAGIADRLRASERAALPGCGAQLRAGRDGAGGCEAYGVGIAVERLHGAAVGVLRAAVAVQRAERSQCRDAGGEPSGTVAGGG
ncbi:condensation domain-containing protein [Burkholderia sp. FERM BP-3421]|nr:condensation domain-containing protein [Burkholderia sp. FERM BP-3421]WDD92414.1 condensation domain-containing protein [Burkholderia sp. FERM BP-3421]